MKKIFKFLFCNTEMRNRYLSFLPSSCYSSMDQSTSWFIYVLCFERALLVTMGFRTANPTIEKNGDCFIVRILKRVTAPTLIKTFFAPTWTSLENNLYDSNCAIQKSIYFVSHCAKLCKGYCMCHKQKRLFLSYLTNHLHRTATKGENTHVHFEMGNIQNVVIR